MVNKIKLLLLGLITPLLCGVSFGVSYDLFENFSSNLILDTTLDQQDKTVSFKAGNYYCYYIDDTNYSPWNTYYMRTQNGNGYGGCNIGTVNLYARNNYCFLASCDNDSFALNTNSYASATIKIYEFSSPLIEPSPCDCPICDDCSSVESQLNICLDTLNTRNGQVASLSGSLSTCQDSLSSCQGDLSSCSNGCDVMVNQCQDSLSGCNENLTSMTNYADSLSSQLNECLANSPEPCEGTGCDEIASGINAIFSFFWERDDQMFSLPIANNVFLPRGYRAYIDSGVVAITEYEKTSYSIDDSSFNEINKSFYSLIYGLIFLSAVALFCYYLKKFISKSFIPKEKKG